MWILQKFQTHTHLKELIINISANKQFEFEIPAGSEKSTVLVENIKGKNYFEIIAKPEIIEREKPNPKEISIYWDASGSMAKRDTAKEFALLEGYLNKIQNCKINLNIFDINKIKKEEFTIKNGDFTALKARLANIDYDGGTPTWRIRFKPR